MAYSIPCNKIVDGSHRTVLYFNEVVKLYLLYEQLFNCDIKFTNIFFKKGETWVQD